MTREEAVEWMLFQKEQVIAMSDNKPGTLTVAYDMAIEALQAESKHGEWELDPNGMDWNIPAWRCSECGFVANYLGVEVNGLSNSPMDWAGSNFCPNCGAKMNKG